MIKIREVSQFDLVKWLEVRRKLFPNKPQSEQMYDIQHYLYYPEIRQAFVADFNGQMIGFIEIIIQDSFIGSTQTPVIFINAWYVEESYRYKGIGKRLLLAAEKWAKSKGCTQIGFSFTDDQAVTKKVSEHLGFRHVAYLNYFLKTLTLSESEVISPEGVFLETNRLIIREAQFKDIETIVDYLKTNKAFHAGFEPPRPHDYYTKAYWQERIYSNYYRPDEDKTLQLFMFEKNESNKTIGYTNYYNIMYGAFCSAHVGYMISESSQGYGYMKEALKAGIQYLFTIKNLHRIQANYMPKNKRSGKTLKSLGFELEGKAKKYLFVNGRWEDHLLTSLTNSEWS